MSQVTTATQEERLLSDTGSIGMTSGGTHRTSWLLLGNVFFLRFFLLRAVSLKWCVLKGGGS